MYYNFEYWLEHAIEKSLRIYNILFLKKPAKPCPEEVKKILICAYHGIGNFILYTPTIAAIKKYFPEAEIHLQVGNKTGCEYVLDGAGYFTKTYDISNRSTWSDWIKHIRKIRRSKYDLIINEFHSNSYFLALMVSLSAAKYRVGHVGSPGWPDRYGFIYNVPVKMQEAQHEVDRYFALARELGIPEDLLNLHPFMYVDSSEKEKAIDFLKNNRINKETLVIGIQMGTSPTMRWKQWQPARYRELVIKLTKKFPEACLLMLGAKNEVEMIKQWTRDINGNIIIAAGETTLSVAAAMIERCNLLVCNDSGLMHVAVAMKTPVVAIYGPTDYRRTAPLGKIHVMIRKTDIACSPCFKLEGDSQVTSCSHQNCLNTIEVDEVLNAIANKINELIKH
ncbi:MAG: glycosyltransferase family 9 protein [Acidobacteria bacterium]|nr:glycosyltransferase family 9 protein [Acidobacteriota bacterium]